MIPDDTPTHRPRVYTVFGGTGFVGRRIVRALLSAGHHVRIAARDPHARVVEGDRGRVERVHADLFEPATLHAALKTAAGAVNATSLYVERGDLTFEAMHVEAAQRLARIATQERIPRLVQISGIGADPDAEDSYVRARGRGERAVRDACPGATIVRPSVMFGKGDALVSAIVGAARMAPLIPLFGSGASRLQPVAASDVADGIAELLTRDRVDPLYEFGGPRVMSYRELVSEILRAAHLRRPLLPIPFAIWRLLARVAQFLPGAPLTPSQVALIEANSVADASLPGLDDLVSSRIDFAEHLRRELEA